MTWEPIWALPNIEIEEPVDNDIVALVPSSDPRIQELIDKYPIFRMFMGQFKDFHGEPIEPTLIIRRSDVTEYFKNIDPIASFRDLVVASTVPLARSLSIINRHIPDRVTYSNSFWVYPWMVSDDYESIIAHTPAMLALDNIGQFSGRSSPDLPRTNLLRRCFDKPLLQELLRRWGARYETNSPKREDVKLFRSLNMVNQACLLPAGTDVVYHDYGRMIGIWVAAFEILVHPGPNGKAKRNVVFKLLQNIPWIEKKCGYRRFKIKVSKNCYEQKNLACWLYDRINTCRNNFMHGNPVDSKHLLLPVSHRCLTDFAATLYRLALTSFLDLGWNKEAPPLENTQGTANYLVGGMEYSRPQEDCEKALQLTRIPSDEGCSIL